MDLYGKLELVIGCMFAGKSGEMIRRYRRYTSLGKSILVINHKKDTRYGKNVISTHDHDKIKCISLENFKTICFGKK